MKLISNIYFRRITLSGNSRALPESMIYLSNHRNGAIDGFVLTTVLKTPIFLIGKNLTRTAYLRVFFGGNLEIYRSPENMRQKRFNFHQFKKARDMLTVGSQVVVFPEGTSQLGPGLLPLKRGVIHLLKEVMPAATKEASINILPIGLHYERGYEFRSNVDICMGSPRAISISALTDEKTFLLSLEKILENVVVLFPNRSLQLYGELFADFALCYTKAVSHKELCLLYAANKVPSDIRWEFERVVRELGCIEGRKTPVVSLRSHILKDIALIISSPIVIGFLCMNAPTFIVSYQVAKRAADDDNVITLWRIIVGVPTFVVQLAAYLAIALMFQTTIELFLALAAYGIVSLLGLNLYDEWKMMLRRMRFNMSPKAPDMRNIARNIQLWLSTH